MYKIFSVFIYNYIKTSGNWENENWCGFVDITVYHRLEKVLVYIFYNIFFYSTKKYIEKNFRVDIELYQHGAKPISVQTLQML